MKLDMRLFKRTNGTFYVEFDRDRRRSLKTNDPVEAKRLYAEIKKQYLAGRLAEIRNECTKTLGAFFDEYVEWGTDAQNVKTFKANRLALNKLIYHAGSNITLDKLNQKHIDQIIAQSRRNKLSDSSINNYIRHCRAVLNKAVEWGYIKVNPFRKVKAIDQDRALPKHIDSDADVTRLLNAADDIEIRRFMAACLSTGRRRIELVYLEWEDINFKTGEYLVRKTKRKLSRWYPMTSTFRAVLESWPREKRTGRVFKKWSHPDTYTHLVKKALVKIGFDKITLHGLRHTFARKYLQENGSMKALQELLGHTEYRTTEIYAHLQKSYLHEEAEKVKLGPVDLIGKR